MSNQFQLISDFSPAGDQPDAIQKLVRGLEKGYKYQTLLGVTGSGKTFTMAGVIAKVNRPTLVISHNKVLAAQLYREFKEFFPNNAVEYFVSYYDYYQPEAYLPKTDTYIEKEVSINDDIDRLRLSATTSLLERKDVIIVASVSCIYGLGTPEDFQQMVCFIRQGDSYDRHKLLKRLVDLQYERNDTDFHRGTFRVRGDTVDVFPSYREIPLRIELFGDEVDRIGHLDPLRGVIMEDLANVVVYPAKHFVTPPEKMERAFVTIEEELDQKLEELRKQNKLLEAQRLEQRTRFDLEMMREIGYCQGIENYSRHLSGRQPGEPPATLISYFPEDFLLVVDESHMMLPQIHGMYGGDRSRKGNLIDFGFRLPSALDNRPLRFDEVFQQVSQAIFVSATPAEYEFQISEQVVEQIIRPTGLVDPEIITSPATGQVDDLIDRIRERVERSERILVTTLTKRMAEELSEYLDELGIRSRYLHFQIETLERVEILKDLRTGEFDVLVGVNLLREGLDLPEVSLVAILDADREGFLRSARSLVQICGRAARNIGGQVILYADEITGSIRKAIAETNRRREKQMEHNTKYNITPQTIKKAVKDLLEIRKKNKDEAISKAYGTFKWTDVSDKTHKSMINELENEMLQAAENLEFERAAFIRDKILELKDAMEKKSKRVSKQKK